LTEKDEYIEEFSQLPSKTGKDVIDLEKYARLPRTGTYKQIEAFLEAARKSKEVKILFIVAEWGEGKTSIYEGLLKKEDVIKSDLVIPISTKRLITYVREKAGSFSDTGSPGIRFFACLLYAIKDVIDNDLAQVQPFDEIKIKEKDEQQATMKFILNGLRSIFNVLDGNSRVFIFIDEFEDIVDETPDIRSFIRAGLVDLMNGYPRCLVQEPFAGRFHLLIAATPPAYERLSSEVFADIGRLFGQRAGRVDLEKLDRKNAYEYILGVLKYCWKGNLPQIPFSEPGMFNTIFLATLGNPRSIINVLESLLTYVKINSPAGKFKIIKPGDFVSALSGKKFNVYGGEISLLDKNSLSMLYNKLEQKCKSMGISVDKCINLAHLLISNLSPISIEYIRQKIGYKEDCWAYINAIGKAFSELWNITEPFLYFKKAITNIDELLHKLPPSGRPPNLSKIIDALTFYEYDQNRASFSSVFFVPYQRLSEISFKNKGLFQNYVDYFTNFSPELRNEDELVILVDRFIFEKVEKSKEEYIILSPTAVNIFYPSPSIFFLDFIDDVDKRFEIGTNLMRNLTAYETEFYKGVISLLESGCKNVRIERIFESHGFKDIEVINVSYVETAQQYKVRARIFSPLKIVETTFHDQIKEIVNDMKTTHIPLLMIFSWNPLPIEIKGSLETHLISERGLGKVFYYLDFPLTTIQCHQIIGYVLARNRNYRIREEKWRARASRIIDELKLEDALKGFINDGIIIGYTLKPLDLEELRPGEVPEILRTLLVTDGNVKKRYEQLRRIEENFRIYGKDFPVCPKDIESESALEKYVRELERNNIVRMDNEALKVDYTPVERRILAILREYGGSIQKDDLDKLFILVSYRDRIITTDIYLRLLTERREIGFDKVRGYFLRDIKMLDEEFERLKKEIEDLEKNYIDFPFGYLISVKQRDKKAIIFRDCIREITELSNSIDKIRFIPDYEGIRIRRQILLELLVNQLIEIRNLLNEFYRALSSKKESYRRRLLSLKRTLEDLEESLNNLLTETEKKIKITEKQQLEEKERLISDLENKVYTSSEIKDEVSKLLESEKELMLDWKDLYREFRGCLFFDVKMVRILLKIIELEKFMEGCSQKIEALRESIEGLRELMDLIQSHKIIVSMYKNKFSSCLQNWVKKNLKDISGGI